MYELIKAGENTFYIDCPAKIGVYRLNDGEAVVIDGGSDKDAGKKILKILAENNWKLTAVYNTHSHADHTGGNALLQERTGCKIYIPAFEQVFTKYPVLEPTMLYGGFAPADLHNKFLVAKESRAEALTPDVLPAGFELIPLPGHSYDMAAIRTPDDVLFLGDCLSSERVLEKYQISFAYDIKAYLESLEKVKTLKASLFIPAHADACTEIADLCDINIAKSYEIAGRITAFCADAKSFEEILQKLFADYALTMTFQQYALVGFTVRSYIAWLRNEGKLEPIISDNRLLWHAV